jgi:hypothetical protein
VTSATEITVITGHCYRVEGDVRDIERAILDAARGSIMQFAWLIESETRQQIGVNPEHVVTIKDVGS